MQINTLRLNGQKSRTFAYFTSFIALGLSTAILGPTLPELAKHTRSNLSEISFLFTARALGYMIGSLQGGRLFDRRPGHPVLAGVLLLMGGALALAPTIPLLWLLSGVLLFLGMSEGALDVGGNLMLTWVHGEKVGPFMNGLHFFFGVGAFLSPLLVAQALLVSGSVHWAYWVIAALLLPMVAWLMALPSPSRQAISRNRPQGKVNLGLVGLIATFFFLYVGAEASYGGWIFTYTTSLGLSEAAAAAYLTSAFWGALTLGRLLSIPLAARAQPEHILLVGVVGCLISVSLILVLPGSLGAVWAGTLGMGLCMAAIFPTTLSLSERRMGLTGQVASWFFVGSGLGAMFLPWLVGQVFEARGPRAIMPVLSIDLILALLVFIALSLKRTRVQVE